MSFFELSYQHVVLVVLVSDKRGLPSSSLPGLGWRGPGWRFPRLTSRTSSSFLFASVDLQLEGGGQAAGGAGGLGLVRGGAGSLHDTGVVHWGTGRLGDITPDILLATGGFAGGQAGLTEGISQHFLLLLELLPLLHQRLRLLPQSLLLGEKLPSLRLNLGLELPLGLLVVPGVLGGDGHGGGGGRLHADLDLVVVEVPQLGGVAHGAAGGALVARGLAGEQLQAGPLPDDQLQAAAGLEVEHGVPELDVGEAHSVTEEDLVARPQSGLSRQSASLGGLDEYARLLCGPLEQGLCQ